MFICKKNEYKEWNDKDKVLEYETYPPRCKHCEAESLSNAYTYDKSNITFHYTEFYSNGVSYPRDAVATNLSSADTIMDAKLFMAQYIEKNFDDMKLVCDGRILYGDEKTLGECKVSRKAHIYVEDMKESDRRALAEAGRKDAAEGAANATTATTGTAKSGTSNSMDVGFGQTKCFQNMN